MTHRLLPIATGLLLLPPAAMAQGPDVIHYTFDTGDATNTATGPVGSGVVGSDVSFVSAGLCAGSGDIAAVSLADSVNCDIDTGWIMDFGAGDWTIGLWLDRTGSAASSTTLQYVFGDPVDFSFRCFVGGVAGADGVMLRGPLPELLIPGGGSTTQPVHFAYCYDSAAGELRGYRDGALAASNVVGPLNLMGMTDSFHVMRQFATCCALSAGTVIDDFRIYRRCIDQGELDDWLLCLGGGGGGLGTSYCGPAVPNSTGFPAVISATGSPSVALNLVTLTASALPPGQFGYFLAGETQGLSNPPGSSGLICLAGNIGRYNQAANIIQGPTGSLQLDLTAIPVNPPQAVAPGETWNFQCWFRDNAPTLTSNFTDGLSITFL